MGGIGIYDGFEDFMYEVSGYDNNRREATVRKARGTDTRGRRGFGGLIKGLADIDGIAPDESIKSYVEGSYAYDATPPASAHIEGQDGRCTLKGGTRGAKFTIDRFKTDAKGVQVSQNQTSISVGAGKTTKIASGLPAEDVAKGYKQMYVIRLADTYYKAETTPVTTTPVTTTPAVTPTSPATTPTPEVATPSEDGAVYQAPPPSALDQLKTFMTAQAIPKVPNYIPVSLVVGGTIVAAIVIAVSKK